MAGALFVLGGSRMKDIRTTDYVSEYEFRRSTGPKYQTSSLRPVVQERKKGEERYPEGLRSDRPKMKERVRKDTDRTEVESMAFDEDNQSDQSSYQIPSNSDRSVSRPKVSNKRLKRRTVQPGKKKSVALIPGKREGKSDGILRIGNSKNRKKSKKNQKDDKKAGKKVVKKATGSLKSAIADMQKSANASWDTDQRWDEASSWDFASEGASSTKGFKKGIEEVIKVIVKVIKAVATTTLLPLILIMTCCLFIVITVLWASSDVSVSGTGKAEQIANPITDKQVIYNGLLETFEGNETAVYGVMCALMAESGCDPTATEATGKWGISAADYTAQVNDGTVSKEEFINSTYKGVQGARGYGIAQWSTTDRKKALYEFAESWAAEKGTTFDIGGIDMQVAHLQETINTSYASLKESLIKEKDMVKACYLWIATYEKPSEKYSTWQEKAERDVRNFAEDLKTECSVSTGQGMFLWPCPSSKSITSYFGNRVAPKAGASTDHKGIDIGASMCAQVIAAAAGKVTTVSYNSARGYFIVVDHGSGYVTLYQHLSRQDVKVGDMVKAGQQIGAVGETGISTAPHLHFEVHVNGTPVDPLQFFE